MGAERYNQRFDTMVKWMDDVDNTLKNIFNDINTMEEFEREKAIFQNICKEADSKREDMKWLVQTLDSLSSHCPENQALSEQKKLEALITRYKNLIPSLEVTMVKTDTLSKCYTYRRDVKEVCNLLKRVREQSKRETQPHSLETVNELNRTSVKIELQKEYITRTKQLLKTELIGKNLTKAHIQSFSMTSVLSVSFLICWRRLCAQIHKWCSEYTQRLVKNVSKQEIEVIVDANLYSIL